MLFKSEDIYQRKSDKPFSEFWADIQLNKPIFGG